MAQEIPATELKSWSYTVRRKLLDSKQDSSQAIVRYWFGFRHARYDFHQLQSAYSQIVVSPLNSGQLSSDFSISQAQVKIMFENSRIVFYNVPRQVWPHD